MRPDQVTAVYALSPSFVGYFRWSLASLPPALAVVVSWCDDAPFPAELRRPGLTVVAPGPMPANFCKARALNAAIQAAATPWVLIADADMLFPRFFCEALADGEGAGCVRRFYIARFTSEHTRRVMAGETAWDRDGAMFANRPRPAFKSAATGALVAKLVRRLLPALTVRRAGDNVNFHEMYGSPNPALYARSFLAELGGYDEDISGWGGEDLDLHRRGLMLGAVEERVPLVVGHLEHPPVTDFPAYRARGNGEALLRAARPARANAAKRR